MLFCVRAVFINQRSALSVDRFQLWTNEILNRASMNLIDDAVVLCHTVMTSLLCCT